MTLAEKHRISPGDPAVTDTVWCAVCAHSTIQDCANIAQNNYDTLRARLEAFAKTLEARDRSRLRELLEGT